MQRSRTAGQDVRQIFLVICSFAIIGCAQKKSDLPVLPDDPAIEQPAPKSGSESPAPPADSAVIPISNPDGLVGEKYSYLDPNRLIDQKLLSTALAYYSANEAKFANRSVITVIDFAKRSSERRLFIIDTKSGGVWAMPVAHGKGSDPDADGFATLFSNQDGSNATSLGVYRGAETYIGKNGLSLRMDGLSPTNSNARARAVVIHGAAYVRDEKVIQGRSWGCPAIPMPYRDKVLSLLKGGSFIYAGLSGKT